MDYLQYKSITSGAAYVPFTFPTRKVKNYIDINWEGVGDYDWTFKKIDNLYNWYKEGVLKEGLPAYGIDRVDKFPLIKYMAEKTGLSTEEVQIFLDSVWSLVKRGTIENKWLAIKIPTTATSAKIKTAVSKYGDIIETQIKSVKWIALAVIIGAGVYFGWPVISKLRKRKKK